MQIFSLCPPVASVPWPVAYAPAFSAGAVLVVGVIAATIAWRQWSTAHTKLQLDLYDKRRPVFLAVRDFISQSDDWLGSSKWLETYRLARIDALFLFGPEVDAYMKELWDEVAARRSVEGGLWKHSDTQDEIDSRHQWKVQQIVRLERLFAPYMTLTFRATRSAERS